ncbi:cell division protein [Candidatus Palibaumannia cicadellinicola]|uniref:Probable GTP-binding protein EngB n=1 Tax=Candidatus Palibaumannia cicadellinicola TaxID=186490 RepID=A0A0K2BKH9_9GAMM|nr:cell division protein [Candidatus Baumannia cicadellinicola]
MLKDFNYYQTRFVLSAPCISKLSYDHGIEIAFTGYSNVGKSSAINILTNHKNLARTSKTPGSTKLINLFEIQPGFRIVDLPGYGYAKIPINVKNKLQHELREYLKKRDSLRGIVLLIDIRYSMKNLDKKILNLAVKKQMPVLLLLTKADKINYCLRKKKLNDIKNNLIPLKGDVQVEVFSSLNKLGINILREKLDSWFSIEN